MILLPTILSIVDSLLKLAVAASDKMTPEQFQSFIERHEKRMEFFFGWVEKLRD